MSRLFRGTLALMLAGAGWMLASATDAAPGRAGGEAQPPVANQASAPAPKATLIELGSVRCIPCKMMQPVMADIEKTYGKRVRVVFYDVWTPEGRPYAEKYKIRAIPTQVFLDKNGREFFRHMGFFAKEEIAKILEKQGVK